MKKLLAAGERRIFSLGKVWRRGEGGPQDAPELNQLEWYRADEPYEHVMEDCLSIVRTACQAVGTQTMQWRGDRCPVFAEAEKLHMSRAFHGLADVEKMLNGDIKAFDNSGVSIRAGDTFSDIFARVLTQKIEPSLGRNAPTILFEYPASEAALSRRSAQDPRLAERFELYVCGVELANGYGELNDPAEQRARLVEAMDEKDRRYRRRWPIDEDFLAALAHMPPASGVALGFDRMVMLAAGARHINDVLWTPQG
jgi:lysyl-tRNA synthetase class 2